MSTVQFSPIDQIIEIENRRIRLGVQKQELSAVAEIKPEMYSYLMRRGRQGFELPEDCRRRILHALDKLEKWGKR